MIVAHPDDEVIFGGLELNDCLVLCLTGDSIRQQEFKNVIETSQCDGIILDFADRHGGWTDAECTLIDNTIKDCYQHFNQIITHNQNGEYGHPQHRQLSKIISTRCKPKTFYLGERITINNKIDLLSLYKSQQHIISLPEIQEWIHHGRVT